MSETSNMRFLASELLKAMGVDDYNKIVVRSKGECERQRKREALAQTMGLNKIGLACVNLGANPVEVADWPDRIRHGFVNKFWGRYDKNSIHCKDTELGH